MQFGNSRHSTFFASTVVVQQFTFVLKAKKNLWNNDDFVMPLSQVVPHNGQAQAIHNRQARGRGKTCVSPGDTQFPSTSQAIIKFVRRNKRNHSHRRRREAYAVHPVACRTLHIFHTGCAIPYSLQVWPYSPLV